MSDFDLIVSNYNNGPYLVKFFDSIQHSTLQPKKVILVDDCSTDNSLEIIDKYININSLDILLIKNEYNIGFANSLNKAINEVTSYYFARLDPDDYVESNRFEIQMKFLSKHKEIDIVGTNVNYFRKNKNIRNSNVYLSTGEIVKQFRAAQLPIIHGTIMGKREVFNNIKYNQNMVPSEDFDIFSQMIKKNYKLINIPEVLTHVLIHENSVSNSLKYNTIEKRYIITKNLFNLNYSKFHVLLDYLQQYFYRKYLFIEGKKRYLYLLLSILARPIKIIKRYIIKIDYIKK